MRERPHLNHSTGERLELDVYRADFQQYFWNIGDLGFWKLERQQHFQEPGVESWEAFHRGDWEESLRLLAGPGGHYQEHLKKVADHGFALHRVRVVEEPIVPYLQWELNLLKLKAECGERTRVIGPERVRGLEDEGPLPEIIVLADFVLYEIVYDADGILAGGVRHKEPATVSAWREFIKNLHAEGEEMVEFFRRRVADLSPPDVSGPSAAHR
ncbi:DUF6879 family protein [Streptomyces clavuligerus]|uniref:DUF6879 domain-containing protein n=1 Tax=Streptomyces clavuligerus TaxID=1901 RepID=E2PZZ2_STRCL|nr:DUF6879 family protein [Streptomyces clavuligerus]ANW18887.1 hypothetical protein BB341_11925 [Streptomyces clavuligerus]AXU13463.1 hypothetical protein D1794_12355 [Streptomyces clavuligerus]EFG08411.1 Hypothetical protein SCLAV_3340 [Streptomyces clavuligerus]MBY6303421.1 hypothetical protein [Streptomyces clavuligerus]QCS06246.1 hypothetical protein CRV15_11790 [Streptomyces clavuligerus]